MTYAAAGLERGAETGLDYFGAQVLLGAQGRFTSPDVTFYKGAGKPEPFGSGGQLTGQVSYAHAGDTTTITESGGSTRTVTVDAAGRIQSASAGGIGTLRSRAPSPRWRRARGTAGGQLVP